MAPTFPATLSVIMVIMSTESADAIRAVISVRDYCSDEGQMNCSMSVIPAVAAAVLDDEGHWRSVGNASAIHWGAAAAAVNAAFDSVAYSLSADDTAYCLAAASAGGTAAAAAVDEMVGAVDGVRVAADFEFAGCFHLQ